MANYSLVFQCQIDFVLLGLIDIFFLFILLSYFLVLFSPGTWILLGSLWFHFTKLLTLAVLAKIFFLLGFMRVLHALCHPPQSTNFFLAITSGLGYTIVLTKFLWDHPEDQVTLHFDMLLTMHTLCNYIAYYRVKYHTCTF